MVKGRDEKGSLLRRMSIGRIISILFSIILLLIALLFLGLIVSIFIGPMPHGNIAVIHISGFITAEGYRYGGSTSSANIIGFINKAEENDEIRAIILDINSGGGSAVGSDEIAQAVKAAEKPTVAVIREVGASGAYWIASAADKIYANRMSVTGSIGVIASYLEFAKLLEDYNITYRRLVAGRYKDMGSSFKELTDDEALIFQKTVDTIHEFFIEAVAENRNMSKDELRKIATGEFMLGVEAKELGLVDELGTKQDAVAYLEEQLNITAELADYMPRPSFYDILSTISRDSFTGLAGLGKEKGEFSLQT